MHFFKITENGKLIESKKFEYGQEKEMFDYAFSKKTRKNKIFLNSNEILADWNKSPSIIDNNRMLRGDYFIKPTAYWFFNCDPTAGFTFQYDKIKKTINKSKPGRKIINGYRMCSEERSLISADYARNFICDFIIGKKQNLGQMSIF